MSWMRTDIDFGVPWRRFVVNIHTRDGRAVYNIMAAHKDDPERMASAIADIVCASRPHLRGCVVISVGMSHCSMRVYVDVVHPNLPRAITGDCPEESLDLCPVCSKPMPIGPGANMYTRQVNRPGDDPEACGTIWVVCSEECVTMGLPALGAPYQVIPAMTPMRLPADGTRTQAKEGEPASAVLEHEVVVKMPPAKGVLDDGHGVDPKQYWKS